MIRIFLSYSTKDDIFINLVASEIKDLSHIFKLWYFSDHMEEYSGIINRFAEKIDNSDFFVVFISRNSLQSNFVLEEIERARKLLESNKLVKFIPLLIDSDLSLEHQMKLYDLHLPAPLVNINSPLDAIDIINSEYSSL